MEKDILCELYLKAEIAVLISEKALLKQRILPDIKMVTA